MQNSGFTETLANHVAATRRSDFSEHLYAHTRVAFADWLCVAIPARDESLVASLMAYAEQMGGNEQSSIIGHEGKTNVIQSALINGAMSHALDYDDTLPQFLGHPSVTLFPGLVALAEWKGYTGEQVMDSFLTGLHAGCWIAQAAGTRHYEKGWHGTSTIGRQAAAAACSHLLGLEPTQTRNALGIAATQACGIKQSFGSMCKPFHAGTAAQGGLTAALLAEQGFDSAPDAYEGALGFFALFDGDNIEMGPDFLAGRHPVELLAQKFHAACHCTHAPIDMIQELAASHNITAAAIKFVDVLCSQISMDAASKTDPKNGLDAKFSINYSMANALIRGNTGLLGYSDEMVADAEVRELMDRIKVRVDDAHRNAGLKTTCVFHLADGEAVISTLDPIENIPTLAVKQEKVANKFTDLCSPILGATGSAELKARIDLLEETDDFGSLMQLTRGR